MSTPSAATTSHRRRSVRIDGHVFEYDERVLEPRPWTALQSGWAVELLDGAAPGPVLELCTGAGHIGLLVAARTDRRLVAVDRDPVACSFARLNAEGNGVAHHVEVRESALESALGPGERFALVLADPPWVPSAGIGRFPEDPTGAIDGGDDGLDVARACVTVAARALAPGGSLLLQLGTDDQADAVLAEVVEVADAGARAWSDGGRRAAARGVVLRLVRDS